MPGVILRARGCSYKTENETDTQCPSFVEDNPIVCHSERG
jgi:hypothetical protein